jgi:hypothetical protein
MRKLESIVLRLTIVFWFIFWGWILWSMYYPPIVFKYNQLPLPVDKQVVQRGETVVITGDYCKYIGNKADVTFSLERKLTEKEKRQHIKDISLTFDEIKNSNLPMGCHVTSWPITIPLELTKTDWRLIKSIHVKVNQFRTVDLEFTSDWFRVI